MSFMRRIMGKTSAGNARDRLQLVLINDRTALTPAALEALKDDLIAALSRYVEFDPQSVVIDIARDGREQRLVADIPLRNAASRPSR